LFPEMMGPPAQAAFLFLAPTGTSRDAPGVKTLHRRYATMFAETLLESSPKAPRRKRWPMAVAFTVETIIAAVVVIVPLLSTGVIPLSARVQIPSPTREVRLEPMKRVRAQTSSSSSPADAVSRPAVVPVVDRPGSIFIGSPRPRSAEPEDPRLDNPVGSGHALNDIIARDGNRNHVKPGQSPPRSWVSEAQVIDRVEPVYPRPAILAGVQGDVKLHAIISRDGRIMSLNVVSGNPMLVQAAREAVSQWRYRPYYLNGQAIEVETFITVKFTRQMR
jgi:periplasmic protein TonB